MAGGLVDFGFGGGGDGGSKGFGEGRGGAQAAPAFEADGLDSEGAVGGDGDLDAAAAHSAPPSKVTSTAPSSRVRRVARSPRLRASWRVLWMP